MSAPTATRRPPGRPRTPFPRPHRHGSERTATAARGTGTPAPPEQGDEEPVNRLLYCAGRWAEAAAEAYPGDVNGTQAGLAIGAALGIAGALWALAIIVAHWRAGRRHPPALSTFTHRHHHARQLAHTGNHSAAEHHYRHLRVAQLRVLGPRHITTVHTHHQLARSLARQGKYRHAEREYRSVLAMRERMLGPDHMSVFVTRLQIAKMLVMQGKFDRALADYRGLHADQARALGPEHPDTKFTADALAAVEKVTRHATR